MAHKITGYYNETAEAAFSEADQLVVEISSNQVVCLVKGADSQEIEGFELFALDKTGSDWSDVFYELRTNSQLLNRTYRDVHCYYNFEEAIIIPGQRFTATSAEDYLSLMYGETDRYDVKYDTIQGDVQMVNAYRIRKSINELMNRHFVLYKPHHTYSRLLEDVLGRNELADHFIKLQFYSNHFIAAVLIGKKLQLVKSFKFETTDDVLYHLANINRQFALDAAHSHTEISGMFETGSALHLQLQSMFGLITLDGIEADGVFKTANEYPSHYFTSFYKLVV